MSLPGFDHWHLKRDVLHEGGVQQPGLLGGVGDGASLPTGGVTHHVRHGKVC